MSTREDPAASTAVQTNMKKESEMAQYTYLTNEDIGDQSMEGYDCYDSAGEKMGDVDGVIADNEMTPRYLVVNSGGFFSTKQYVVPFGEIARVDDNDKRVYFLSLTKDRLKSGSYPEYNGEWWDSNDHASWSNHERQVAQAYGGTRTATATPVDYNSDLYRRRPENTGRLQLMEERLRANKERYQAGQVTLGKRIVERQESVDVPITEERVVIERTQVADGTPARGNFGSEQTIDVPVMKERANVEKEAVVREEVGVRKEAVQRTERVQDTVRREELDVKDGQGLVNQTGAGMDERQRRMASPEGPVPTERSRTETSERRS